MVNDVTAFSKSSVMGSEHGHGGDPTRMLDDAALHRWFCQEVLPLEASLTRYIRRNWRVADDIPDIRQGVYESALTGARSGIPASTSAYIHTIARNALINRFRRAQVVSFELVADLDGSGGHLEIFAEERGVIARDELRRALEGLNQLPPRCREVVRLRKVEGYTTRETADQLGVTLHTVERQLTLGMRALVDFMLGGSGKIDRKAASVSARRHKP